MTIDQFGCTYVQHLSDLEGPGSGDAEKAVHVLYTNHMGDVAALSDEELLTRLRRCARAEREATAALIAHLAEVDSRRLYAAEGHSSMFKFCTDGLHFSESEAYLRIEVARVGRRYPVVLGRLAQGAVHLTGIGLLGPHLTEANHRVLLDEATYKSKRQIELIIARLRPQPDVPATIRKLPQPRQAPSEHPAAPAAPGPVASAEAQFPPPGAAAPPLAQASAAPAPLPAKRPIVVPLAPERFKIQFTMSAQTHEKLRRAQDLLQHQIPGGDPAAVFDRALTALLDDLARKKLGAAGRPREAKPGRKGSRHIPAHVRRKVWQRDGGRCAFVAENGRRCSETGGLEFHHAKPYALGGEATVENVEVRCRRHNLHEAELVFGPREPSILRECLDAYGSGGRGLAGGRWSRAAGSHQLGKSRGDTRRTVVRTSWVRTQAVARE